MNNARITKELKSTGIKFIRVKTENQKKCIGIHLLRPSQTELIQAAEDAEHHGFPAIYIHNFSTWPVGKTWVRS